jgi:hypothetical protein
MTDHVWETTLMTEAVLGFPPNPHRIRVFAPDALATAITGQICAISLDHGNGVKFVLGVKWLQRARDNAVLIEQQSDDL